MYSNLHNPAVLVFDGVTSNQIGVVRGFGRRKIPIYLISCGNTFVKYSRYIRKVYHVQSWAERPRKFMREFAEICKSNSGTTVIPTDDASSLLASKYKKKLERFVKVIVADYDVVNIFVSKDLFYKKMNEIGVPILKSELLRSRERIVGMLKKYGKLFLKPADSRAQKNYFVIESRNQLDRFLNNFENNTNYIVQKWIPDYAIYMIYIYRDDRGNVSYCGYDKIRQYPPYAGSGCFVVTKCRYTLINSSIRILERCNYCGIAEFEYKYDPGDGTWYLLEVNPRTTTQSAILDKAGVDIEYFAYQCTNNANLKCQRQTNFHEGIKWILEIDDFLCMIRRRSDRTITFSKWLQSLRGISTYGIWASDDPMPALCYVLFFIVRKIKIVLNRYLHVGKEN